MRRCDLSLPLYARRQLTIFQYEFPVDAEVPWRELGLTEADVLQLFRVFHLDHFQTKDVTTAHWRPNQLPEPRPDGTETDDSVTSEHGLRLDGPTIEDWVEAGYMPETYEQSFRDGQLQGFAVRLSPGLLAYRVGRPVPWKEDELAARREAIAKAEAEATEAARVAAYEALLEPSEVVQEPSEQPPPPTAPPAQPTPQARSQGRRRG